MAEADDKEGIVTLEEKCLRATEETYFNVLYTASGVKKQEDERDSVMQPLLQHKHRDSHDETHRADTQTTTDVPDPKTSVSQELGWAGGDQLGCSGSVRSVRSDSSRHECPVCSELFDSRGVHRLTLLHCNHALCHRCIAGILERAKDPGRLQCPFCRQTTPFPQWEIRRLQEESYFSSVCEPPRAFTISPAPELQAVPVSPLSCSALERQLRALTLRNICECCVCPSCLVRGWRLMQLHSLCLAVTALLLLLLLLLACFLYIAVPAVVLSILFRDV